MAGYGSGQYGSGAYGKGTNSPRTRGTAGSKRGTPPPATPKTRATPGLQR